MSMDQNGCAKAGGVCVLLVPLLLLLLLLALLPLLQLTTLL